MSMNDEVNSTASFMSQMSVSYDGQDDVALEQVLDDVFLRIQEYVNHTHCNTRQYCAMFDQDNDYEQEVKQMVEVWEQIDGMEYLFGELRSVMKQCLPKKPSAEDKTAGKKIVDAYKESKKKSKSKAVSGGPVEESKQ
jgi:hypothetical protein